MTGTRGWALAAGVFYLLTFAFSIPAYFLYEPVLTDPPTSSATAAPTPG